jgi:predicted transcriptional regulator
MKGPMAMTTIHSTARPFVLSIRPTYVERILAGHKTIELRRRFPSLLAPGIALIYATAPVQAIVATVQVAIVETLSISALWRRRGRGAAVTREEFDAYFDGTETGCALLLRDVVRLPTPIHLTVLAHRFEFSPPQSYCYWKASLDELTTTHGWVKAATRH